MVTNTDDVEFVRPKTLSKCLESVRNDFSLHILLWSLHIGPMHFEFSNLDTWPAVSTMWLRSESTGRVRTGHERVFQRISLDPKKNDFLSQNNLNFEPLVFWQSIFRFNWNFAGYVSKYKIHRPISKNWNPKRVGYTKDLRHIRASIYGQSIIQSCVADILKVWYWIYWKIKILSRNGAIGSRSINVNSLYVATWWDQEFVWSSKDTRLGPDVQKNVTFLESNYLIKPERQSSIMVQLGFHIPKIRFRIRVFVSKNWHFPSHLSQLTKVKGSVKTL